MRTPGLHRYALGCAAIAAPGVCAIAALLAGCGISQQVVGAPGAIPQAAAESPYKLLYSFSHAAYPQSSLIDVKGTLYGTTEGGGANNGTVYSVSTAGVKGTLHAFKGGSDGAHPEAGMIGVDGTLYGTTYEGGGTGCGESKGCGTVYSVSRAGTEKVLYSFAGGSDGAHPQAGLIDVNGMLYGTTYQGGGGPCKARGVGIDHGCGTVYGATAAGKEKVVYSFTGGTDGEFPEAGLLELNGSLYGTTNLGGLESQGTVFRLTTAGVKKVLHNFGAGTDGANPQAALIYVKGTLYGTTAGGGELHEGTVFSMRTTGAEQVLYSFTGRPDGYYPSAGLVSLDGILYGTTVSGGADREGTVYSLSASGAERVLHSFTGGTDGANPQASFVTVNGRLYGTTARGGSGHGFGTVFTLSP